LALDIEPKESPPRAKDSIWTGGDAAYCCAGC